ncbi:MAG: hypothetical protein JST00_37435 [Deltaproteobacteria bacterium]|nr:hypothetical protein [Deltaproteobacteria bacterium]
MRPRILGAIALTTTFAAMLPTRAHAEPMSSEQCEAASVKAQRQRLAHALLDARKEALACSAADCPAVIRRDCDRWVGEIEALLPSVVPVAQDASGADMHDVSVKMDAKDLKQRLDGAGIQVDPGLHVFTFTAANGARVEVRAVLREGERNRPIVAAFPAEAVPPPSPPRSSGPPIPTYVFGGVSLLAFAAWGYFGLSAISDYGDLESTCGPTRTCNPSDVGSARDKMAVADVAFGVAIVSAGAAVAFWLANGARGPVKPAMRVSF